MPQMTDAQFAALIKAVKNDQSLPDAPKGPTPEFLASVAKQKEIQAATHKTRKYAYYMVGPEGGFVGGKPHVRGDVVQVPRESLPSRTWQPVTEKGVAVAEAELKKRLAAEAELVVGAKDDDALETDELQAGQPGEDDSDDEPEAEEAPAPKAPKAKKPEKPAPKKGKAGKSNRASDQDVA